MISLPPSGPAGPLPPSGGQITIMSGDQTAVVTEVGATLREYSVGGRAVVDGFPVDAMCTDGRGQVLAPWPNRLEDGEYAFEGTRAKAPLDEPERACAIHGLVRWSAWNIAGLERDRVSMTHVLHPQPAYPFRLFLSLTYQLGPGGLAVTIEAENHGDHTLPLGVGFHPYLTLGGRATGERASPGAADQWVLCVPARTALVSDARGLPRGRIDVAGSDLDFAQGRRVGATVLDTAFTDLRRDPDGSARISLRDPSGERQVALWVDRAFRYVMCFTGDTLAPGARRRSVALEPMTCPPNALHDGRDLVRLEPRERWSACWGVSPA